MQTTDSGSINQGINGNLGFRSEQCVVGALYRGIPFTVVETFGYHGMADGRASSMQS